jgi:hypothetical protein
MHVVLIWLARVVPAAILLLASLSKLTGAADAVTLFTLLRVEPWGRILLGAVELITAALLLWPRSSRYGALLGIGLMTGALGTHLFKIGITYGGDASLFIMALTVLGGCIASLALQRRAWTHHA